MKCPYERINEPVWMVHSKDAEQELFLIRSPIHRGFLGVPVNEDAPMLLNVLDTLPSNAEKIACPHDSDEVFEVVYELIIKYLHFSGMWPDTLGGSLPEPTTDDKTEGGEN